MREMKLEAPSIDDDEYEADYYLFFLSNLVCILPPRYDR